MSKTLKYFGHIPGVSDIREIREIQRDRKLLGDDATSADIRRYNGMTRRSLLKLGIKAVGLGTLIVAIHGTAISICNSGKKNTDSVPPTNDASIEKYIYPEEGIALQQAETNTMQIENEKALSAYDVRAKWMKMFERYIDEVGKKGGSTQYIKKLYASFAEDSATRPAGLLGGKLFLIADTNDTGLFPGLTDDPYMHTNWCSKRKLPAYTDDGRTLFLPPPEETSDPVIIDDQVTELIIALFDITTLRGPNDGISIGNNELVSILDRNIQLFFKPFEEELVGKLQSIDLPVPLLEEDDTRINLYAGKVILAVLDETAEKAAKKYYSLISPEKEPDPKDFETTQARFRHRITRYLLAHADPGIETVTMYLRRFYLFPQFAEEIIKS